MLFQTESLFLLWKTKGEIRNNIHVSLFHVITIMNAQFMHATTIFVVGLRLTSNKLQYALCIATFDINKVSAFQFRQLR